MAVVVDALWLFLPCYMANMAPVGAARLAPTWSRPLDGNRVMRDGHRALGETKTWRGLAAGILAGGLTTLLLAPLASTVGMAPDFGLQHAGLLPAVLFGAALGAGALLGDAVKSFVKRRRGVPPSKPWVPFDQLDAVVGGLIAAVVAAPVVAGWSIDAYFGSPWTAVVIIIATPGLQWLSSVAAYAVGLKKHPW